MVKTGWIYTRDGSFVWYKLRQRTVPCMIILLFIPFFAQDGWSICSMNQTHYVQVPSPKEFKSEPCQVTTPHLKEILKLKWLIDLKIKINFNRERMRNVSY